MGVLLPGRRMTHVTRACVGTHHEYGVKHHLAPYPQAQVVEVDGFCCLNVGRTAIDRARPDSAGRRLTG